VSFCFRRANLETRKTSHVKMPETFEVEFVVRDPSATPLAQARIATRFIKWMKEESLRAMAASAETNEQGRATILFEDQQKPIVLIGYSDDWKLGGYVVIDRSHEGKTVEFELTPTVTLLANHTCNELPSALKYSITELSLEDLSYSCIGFHTCSQRIEFPVPRGDWLIRRYGKYIARKPNEKLQVHGESPLDLGNVNFEPHGFAKIKDTIAPEFSLAAVRGRLPADVRIADFAGKWLLLAFWAYG